MERDKKRRICDYCEESVSKTNFYLKHRNGNCSKKNPVPLRSGTERITEANNYLLTVATSKRQHDNDDDDDEDDEDHQSVVLDDFDSGKE